MVCPKCSCENVQVSMVQDKMKMSHNTGGIGQLCYSLFRICMMFCIIGFFMPKRIGSSNGKIKSSKMAVCQSCGYSWKV